MKVSGSSGQPLRVIDLVIEAKLGGQDAVYTYLWDDRAKIGDAYLAPLGARQVLGYVARIRDVHPADLGFPADRLRKLFSRVNGLSIPAPVMKAIEFVAQEYLCPVPVALSLAAAPGVRSRLVTKWEAGPAEDTLLPISPAQASALRVLVESPGGILETKSKPLAAGSKKALQALVARGLVTRELSISRVKERHRLEGNFRITLDGDRVENFLKKEAKKKPAQALTLMRLQGSEITSFTAQEIKALSETTDQALRALIQAGLLEQVDPESIGTAVPLDLNELQRKALVPVIDAIRKGSHEAFLLFGVTGSGKTEVYLRAAQEALKTGKQVLYLVPEIALTAQVIAQLRSRFGKGVAVLHSNLDQADRLENWLRIREGEAAVVLGARSALFAPIERLGLIVLDEEHEGSYKQESAPRYHAKRVAIELSRRAGVPIILGSATPSVESFFEAHGGGLHLLELPRRAANAKLPDVTVEDLTELYRSGHPSIFSPSLESALKETLEREEQAILFLNRRAFAPFLVCRDCGHQFACPNCSVSLALHRAEGRLRCHQCGFSEGAPDTCPNCSSTRVRPFGAGTQKVEEAVQELMPDARVGRLDRDVARKKGAVEATLAAFRGQDLQILVGTQMVAKGLDFPKVTLVGVVAADVSLNIPDFRASERTFQLLSQVAGRAGRADRPGKVIIQTFNPTHPAIVRTVQHDYIGLYEQLIEERREAGYPPYQRLVNVTVNGREKAHVAAVIERAKASAEAALPAATVLGPTTCALERLNGEWRMHILIKVDPESSLAPLLELFESRDHQDVSVVVDVDPMSIL